MMIGFTGCDDDSSNNSTYEDDDNDYGRYSKEYWDSARDAWDANA